MNKVCSVCKREYISDMPNGMDKFEQEQWHRENSVCLGCTQTTVDISRFDKNKWHPAKHGSFSPNANSSVMIFDMGDD